MKLQKLQDLNQYVSSYRIQNFFKAEPTLHIAICVADLRPLYTLDKNIWKYLSLNNIILKLHQKSQSEMSSAGQLWNIEKSLASYNYYKSIFVSIFQMPNMIGFSDFTQFLIQYILDEIEMQQHNVATKSVRIYATLQKMSVIRWE
jgi:hypothetical protein